MHKLKVAVVGCGGWGRHLVRNFSELEALDSVYDSNLELSKKMAKEFGATHRSFCTILQSDLDGVVISAPAALHYSLAKQVLNAGKHVFVEKPLSLQLSEAKELCDLAKRKEKVLMVGHLLQYHPAFLRLKELVAGGQLGKLQYIHSNRLNLGKFRTEENILWSFAPHDISMILGLTENAPQSVFATGSAHLHSHIHDVTTTHLTFKNNVKAHIFVSWLHPFKEQKLVVIGSRGMAVFDDGLEWPDKLKLYPHQIHWINGCPKPEKAEFQNIVLEKKEPLKTECQHFLECISKNCIPRTNGEEGLRVLNVLDAAQKSLFSGAAVLSQEEEKEYYCHDTACLDGGCSIGKGTKIWHFSHVLEKTTIGKNCTIGQNVMIGPSVVVGNHCKIQNNVSIYRGVTLQDGVFCGPSAVFTNVNTPRSTIDRSDQFLPTSVEKGVTIGANATILCGNRLGAYCFIGAGAVVTKDVKPHALVAGNPARQIGWVSHAGEKLDESMRCPKEGRQYKIDQNGYLQEIVKQGCNATV